MAPTKDYRSGRGADKDNDCYKIRANGSAETSMIVTAVKVKQETRIPSVNRYHGCSWRALHATDCEHRRAERESCRRANDDEAVSGRRSLSAVTIGGHCRRSVDEPCNNSQLDCDRPLNPFPRAPSPDLQPSRHHAAAAIVATAFVALQLRLPLASCSAQCLALAAMSDTDTDTDTAPVQHPR